ncbi:MAG: diaminopimelate epimerase [Deltaproteobacteria bacterium]|nr:diaminopimelate epimerase [Deltaproteobacteria bacterium]
MENRLPFWKMQGSGNDFVLIDHRRPLVAEADRPGLVKKICAPKFGVGADGLIFIETSAEVDFRWRFFNADGSEAEMCGNGGRCAARFAFLNGVAREKMAFETLAGVIQAEVLGRRVKLELSRPHGLQLNLAIPLGGQVWTGHFINTGVPHVVLPVDDLAGAPVAEVGRAVRYHPLFQPAGTNVNFVKVSGPQEIQVRTYERGVEAETLACGTGAVAAALIFHKVLALPSPLKVHPSSGETLKIYFDYQDGNFRSVFLEGDASVVFQGDIWLDELT